MTLLRDAPKGAIFKGQLDNKKAKVKANSLFSAQERELHLSKWRDIKRYQLPFIGHLEQVEGPEQYDTDNVIDSYPTYCNNIFAAGVMSGLTPPSRQWFKLTLANSGIKNNHAISSVLDQRYEIMQSVFQKSNFYTACYQVYSELAFGEGAMAIYWDSRTGIRCEQFAIGTYAMSTGANGIVDTFCVRREMTLQQLIEAFGLDALPMRLRPNEESTSQLSQMYEVYWLVEPNRDYIKGEIGKTKMKYRSYYWLSDDESFLEVGGFNTFPVAVARYHVNGNEVYGKGAGWYANDDAKMLQVQQEDKLSAVELQVKPPMQASSNIAYSINLIPGSITPVDNPNDRIQPLFNVAINLEHLLRTIEETKESIRRAYNADLFLMMEQIDSGQMTAREVMERSQEKLQQLGPVVERLQYEFLNTVIERAYSILAERKLFPEIPDELKEHLAGKELKIDFTSPLAQAQKMAGLTTIEQAVGFITSLMQAYPEVQAKIDPIGLVNEYTRQLGAPAAMFRSDEEAQALLQQQQQAVAEQQALMEQQAMLQQVPGIAKATKDVTDAANNGGNEAMADWLGMPGLGGDAGE